MESALVKVEGYKTMTADVKKQEAVITFDPSKTNPQALAKAITDNTDFKATVAAAGK